MGGLGTNGKVIQLARDLNLEWQVKPIDEIVRFCWKTIKPWIPKGVSSIQEIEELVCKRLSIRLIEIWSDDDLEAEIKKFVSLGDIVIANARNSLENNWTFAEMYERQRVSEEFPERYVAFIDCRTVEKSNRRFFTRWHEIAHILTLTPQMQLPFNRSSVNEKCPIEQLMDIVAGDLAFYSPLFDPIVQKHLDSSSRPSFEAIRNIRDEYCPHASFQATAYAVAKHTDIPMLITECSMAYKKNEAKIIYSSQFELFPSDKPSPKLRAVSVSSNQAATSINLRINRNMRVPEESVIATAFGNADHPILGAWENLQIWTSSNGSSLAPLDVYIEVQGFNERVLAIISTIGP